jgi:hypothetical protein
MKKNKKKKINYEIGYVESLPYKKTFFKSSHALMELEISG